MVALLNQKLPFNTRPLLFLRKVIRFIFFGTAVLVPTLLAKGKGTGGIGVAINGITGKVTLMAGVTCTIVKNLSWVAHLQRNDKVKGFNLFPTQLMSIPRSPNDRGRQSNLVVRGHGHHHDILVPLTDARAHPAVTTVAGFSSNVVDQVGTEAGTETGDNHL